MDGGLSGFENGTIGKGYYAPQTRLVKEDGTDLTVQGSPVVPDIVSATITLPADGVAQLKVTLNNQRFSRDGQPVAPGWKYNQLKELVFGQRLRVDMRYGSEGWTPMILARITDMAFTFPSAGAAQTVLQGEDLLSLLKIKPKDDIPYKDKHEEEIVVAELGSASFSEGRGGWLGSGRKAFTTKLHTVTHQKSKTYLEFIQSFANRMDHEVYVAFDSDSPVTATGAKARPVKIYFEPVRSATLGTPITLHWGRDIVEFKPTLKVWQTLVSGKVSGGLPRRRGKFDKSLATKDVINDLHTAPASGPETPKAPISAPDYRLKVYSAETPQGESHEEVKAENIDEARGVRMLETKLRGSARSFLSAEITTIGSPRLKPGSHVNLTGFYPPFDGIYYVSQAVHALSAAGYTTKLTVQRPGLLDPHAYPAG